MKKIRADQLLVERGLAPSRARAQALIAAGAVVSGPGKVEKAGQLLAPDAELRLLREDHPFVSRGGLKLQHAIGVFKVDVQGKSALDIGSSTGGFTDVLLQAGARDVTCVDVGENLLDWKIRSDKRVRIVEGINARYLKFEDLGRTYDLIVCDVSFISLSKIVPALMVFAEAETVWVTLIKPQFEVGPERVGKGGIVRDSADHEAAVKSVTRALENLGLERLELVESPIKGSAGNREFLACWRKQRT